VPSASEAACTQASAAPAVSASVSRVRATSFQAARWPPSSASER
jgi:hypothetical protein